MDVESKAEASFRTPQTPSASDGAAVIILIPGTCLLPSPEGLSLYCGGSFATYSNQS